MAKSSVTVRKAMTARSHHIHLVSDSTGETAGSLVRACMAQFHGISVREHHWSLIRTTRQLDMVFEGIARWPGVVICTFVDAVLNQALAEYCERNGLQCVNALESVLGVLERGLGIASSRTPGRQHVMDSGYFARIAAMDFAIATDDGGRVERVVEADVVLIGVSRTSKTPVCMYLANRGIMAANIPLVPGITKLPDILNGKSSNAPLVVGLTRDPEGLVEIRRSRLRSMNDDPSAQYANPESVQEEILQAKRLFSRLGCPVIDVTRRSIEETAAEIMMLLELKRSESDAGHSA